MSPKRKKAIMIRRHIAAPDWLWLRVEAAARADGRSVTELVRRLIINYLRKSEDRLLIPTEGGALPDVSKVGAYRRAADWSPPTEPLKEPAELAKRRRRG